MALPAGVTTATVTVGVPVTHTGGEVKTFVSIEPSAFLVHAETGTPLVDFLEELQINEGVAGQFTLPHTDQAGFTDESGNAYTNWYYTARVTYSTPSKAKNKAPKIKVFQLTTGQTVVDLDKLPGGAPALPYTAPTAKVDAFNGRTGSVELLEADLPERLSEGELSATYGDLVTVAKSIPAALGWGATPAITPTLTNLRGGSVIGDVGVTAKELFATYSQAQAAPTNRYYVAPTGNDTTNNGTAMGTPFRTIKKAIDTANAAGASARIMVQAGTYLDTQGFEGTSPTVDMAFIAHGGVATASTGMATAAYTFAAHATHTKTYYINPTPASGVSRVLDLTRVNEFGNYVELTKVASEVIANETPNSYYEGTALYIHRADGAAVTSANTRVLLTKSNFILSAEKNVYVGTEDGSPWVLEGSANLVSGVDAGTVIAWVAAPTNAAEKALVMENVRSDFAGEPTASANSFSVDKWNGVAAFFNCQGNAPSKDAFNAHNAGNLATKALFLTVNCSSTDAGRGNQSCNGMTLHENVIGIDVAGRYVRARGGNVHNIGTSRQYLLGTHVDGDLGDLNNSGSIYPTAVLVNNNAEVWAERVTINMPAGTFAYRTVAATSKIHRKDCEPTRQPDAGPGVFDTF